MNRKGKLYFRYGTMGSAKTALLLTTAYNFEERKMKYVCLKPVVDTRDLTNVIKSRIGIQRECKWIYHETDLYELAQSLFEESMAVIDWFLVDEAQFLDKFLLVHVPTATDGPRKEPNACWHRNVKNRPHGTSLERYLLS